MNKKQCKGGIKNKKDVRETSGISKEMCQEQKTIKRIIKKRPLPMKKEKK